MALRSNLPNPLPGASIQVQEIWAEQGPKSVCASATVHAMPSMLNAAFAKAMAGVADGSALYCPQSL